ncbi:MAG TPA: hypothetical protein DEP46_10465 [Blastocatellia bacterium]|nr:hypothetical protein [Blastocatellia bacterium]
MHIKFSKFVLIAAVLTMLGLTVGAQTPGGTPSADDMSARVKQLESEVETMRREMAELKAMLGKNASAKPADPPVKPDTRPADVAKTDVKPAPQPKKDLGVDVGSARITPYGTIYFNAFGNSGGTNNADVPLFATPTGSGNVSASVRQTRLGARIEGAKVGNARLSAILEADFFGGFPSVGIGENFGVVRLRLANARLDWEKTSVTIGQDWMVFAPVNPTSLAAAAIPKMAGAGNNWARLPQIKIERKITPNITWQGAVLAPQTGDFATNAAFFIQPTTGAASRVPFLQSRIAFSGNNWLGSKKSGAIGLSGHYGRSRVFTGAANFRNDIDTYGFAVDWNLPLTNRVGLSGEAFFGKNLGGFQAGVFQSYNNDFAYRVGSSLVRSGVRSIGTRGGWMQVGFTPPALHDRLTLYGSLGIDDPDNRDLLSISSRDWRTRNLVIATNVAYRFTPQFTLGAEFRRLRTNYFLSGLQISNHVNLGASYSF